MTHLAPLVQALLAFAGALLPVLASILTAALLKRLKVRQNSDQWNTVMRCAGVLAGNVYKAMAHGGASIADVHIANGAVAQAAQLLADLVPREIAALGLTPDRVAQIVSASFGKLLAVDPTVSLAAPSPAVGVAAVPAGAAAVPQSAAPAQVVPAPNAALAGLLGAALLGSCLIGTAAADPEPAQAVSLQVVVCLHPADPGARCAAVTLPQRYASVEACWSGRAAAERRFVGGSRTPYAILTESCGPGAAPDRRAGVHLDDLAARLGTHI